MKNKRQENSSSRRRFFRTLTLGSLGLSIPWAKLFSVGMRNPDPVLKPATNIADALKYPRTVNSMPGKFPARVVQVFNAASTAEGKPVFTETDKMIRQGMLELTGMNDLKQAWGLFVSPNEVIGLKVNPVAGKLLSTSHEVVKAVIAQLEETGIPRKNIVIWDRREFELTETGFTAENYPGITIRGTEQQDLKGSYYNAEGKLYGDRMIDRELYYWADVEGKYDAETMPYMVNEGKYSYYSRICTKEVDKIINIPILKNAGSSVTLALKNLAFGSVSNTGRLHKDLWAETCAEVCAFPPLRDKVVLNIADGIRGCFEGGPGANPQFITEFKTILLATDPVAMDRVGYELILKKRIAEKIQSIEKPGSRNFLELAGKLGLGEPDLAKIDLRNISLA
jgi:hypothetical protein